MGKRTQTEQTERQVEVVDVAALVPYERNARTHSPEQVAQIVASIREWGWTNPILVDEKMVILAGHGRRLAAIELGLARVPCIVAKGWTTKQKRAYVIADNKLAENAGWDLDALRFELEFLREAEFDLDLTGFDAGEVLDLFKVEGDQADPDAAPEVLPETYSRRGDVWVLGPHRLMCGDSTKEDDVAKLMGERRAELVFTDPPYGVAYQGSGKAQTIAGDITQAAIPLAFKSAIDHATTKDARLYFCGGSSNVQMYYALFDSYLRSQPALIIWDKGSIVLRRNNYHSQFEVIFFGWKGKGGGPSYWFSGRKADEASDIWDVKRDSGAEYLHPTQKPTALAERAMRNSCPAGGLVFEPFSGSGSSLIAAERTERVCCAMEIDPRFVDVAVRRWQTFTGREAVRESDGVAFNALAPQQTEAA